jgi:hypothetical protein
MSGGAWDRMGGMYKGLSYSPQRGSFGFGADPGPSDLENLIAGRERKLSDLVDQSVVESLFGGNKDVTLPTRVKNVRGQFGSLAQNGFCSFLVGPGGFKSGK